MSQYILPDVLNQFHTKNIKEVYIICPKENCSNELQWDIAIDEAEIPFNEQRYFKPVDKLWMISTSIKFNLPIKIYSTTCVAENTTKLLTKPKCTIDVAGDGNCWYRCISLWITNSEDNHKLIRNHLHQVTIS